MSPEPGTTLAWAGVTLVLAPLLAALLVYLVPGRRTTPAVAVAAGVVVLSAVAALASVIAHHGPVHVGLGGHAPPLGIAIAADGMTLAMLVLTAAVMAAVGSYTRAWLRDERGVPGANLAVVVLLLWAALDALFLAADLFNLYVALEITTLSALLLVVLTPGAAAAAAAMRYLLFALAGSGLYLLAVAVIYADAGLLAFAPLAPVAGGMTMPALALATAGLAIKGAVFPVHAWLPAAHSVAPSPASALLSGLVATGAVYAIVRLWLGPFAGIGSGGAATGVAVVGVAGMVYASLQALRQPRLKLVIAYSTVAQLAHFLLALPLASLLAWKGVIYLGVAHGLAKAALFLAAGNLIRASGHDRLGDLVGADRCLKVTLVAIVLAGVSLAGLPPSGGFIGKWWLIRAALASGQWWWAIAVAAGGLLTAAYVFRIVRHGLARPNAEATRESAPHAPPVTPAMTWAPLALAGAAIALGFTGALVSPGLAIGAP